VIDRKLATWVTTVEGRPARLSIRRCRLRVTSGPDAGLEQTFDVQTIRVGSRPEADLVLTDPAVSGVHFEIRLGEHGYRLRDLGSTNGTWVAGLRLRDAYLEAELIHVGRTTLQFEPLDDAADVVLSTEETFGPLVGSSAAMRRLFALLERIAPSDATVLVTGETGSGKDAVAEAIHQRSPRAGGPFIVLDCGALTHQLAESELFGHERGAFTGADTTREGAFEQASGGTLLIDAIDEMSPTLQPKLLGVLERREVRRVGGGQPRPVDVRVIATTRVDLTVAIDRGRFRSDLYYRLAVAQVEVPPLRERQEDIEVLVEHFLAELPEGHKARITPETTALMQRYDWPGNVRELRNVVERSILLGAELGAAELRPNTTEELRIELDVDGPYREARQRAVDEVDRRLVSALLARHEGNLSAAARAAGIDRVTLHKLVQRLGLRRR
jgi:DNA-binding NtrC family response regulator